MNILVVVDMQNDFINGSLGTKEAQGIVNNVSKEINAGYDYIFLTQDTHLENYLSSQEGKFLPVEHCILGTYGWEINDKVKSAALTHNATFIQKDIFGSYQLIEELSRIQDLIDSITIVGLCTDICVISNALMIKSRFPEIPMRCIENCCAGVTPEKHAAAIEVMKSCQIEII